MKVLEDLVAPAVVADLVSRLISFLASRYMKRRSREGTARRLQLLTFKIHAVVDEAQQRDLASNQRLLMWVKELVEGMYLAYFMLDITTIHGCMPVNSSCSFRLPRPAKRPCLIGGSEDFPVDQQSAVLRRLEAAVADMKEFVLLLACCPRIQGPPVPSFCSDKKFMFGRLVEREQIISFLLRPGSNLGVLPIVGGPEVGKEIIVKHVCIDERVRGHFAVIIYSYGSLLEENCVEDMLRTLRTGGHVLHESSSAPRHGRYLLVIKNTYGTVIKKEAWAVLCESLRFRAPGSKVILISENDNNVELGTAVVMRVKPLPQEEYWYFFRSLAFGGDDLEEHPELAALGRQIATALNGSFFGAKVLSTMLRMNLDVQFWQNMLNVVQSIHETMRGHGDCFSKFRVANIALKMLPVPLRLKSSLQKTPMNGLESPGGMNVQELLQSAGVPHREEMRIVLWESACPPNYRYTVVCEKLKEHPGAVTERRKQTKQQ